MGNSIHWNWQDFWEFFGSLETDTQRTWAMAELNKDDWIKRLSPETQYKVFQHAPMTIKKSMKNFPKIFHSETLVLLQMDSDRKYKKMRKYLS